MLNTEQLGSEFYLITIIAKARTADKIDDLFYKKGTSGATTFLATCFDNADRQSIMDLNGQRKDVLSKVAHRDQLDNILSHVVNRYPLKDKGDNFLCITRLSGLAGLEGYDDVEDNTSFTEVPNVKDSPYKMVVVISDHGQGEDYIDATQREEVLQHILVKGHGSARISNNYKGRYFQPEKDIVMQIIPSEQVKELLEVSEAYEGIQFSEAGAIVFTRDIVYLHRF